MSITVLVVGLKTPSWPSLPVFTCARLAVGRQTASRATPKSKVESIAPALGHHTEWFFFINLFLLNENLN